MVRNNEGRGLRVNNNMYNEKVSIKYDEKHC